MHTGAMAGSGMAFGMGLIGLLILIVVVLGLAALVKLVFGRRS